MTALEALQAALETCHAVIYGYGLVGAHLSGAEQSRARAAYDVHRARRDALAALVRAAGGTPVPPAPSYAPPAPVADRLGALGLAVHLEEAVAGAAYDVVGAARGDARRWGVETLSDAAVRATGWRLLEVPGAPATVAFPGRS